MCTCVYYEEKRSYFSANDSWEIILENGEFAISRAAIRTSKNEKGVGREGGWEGWVGGSACVEAARVHFLEKKRNAKRDRLPLRRSPWSGLCAVFVDGRGWGRRRSRWWRSRGRLVCSGETGRGPGDSWARCGPTPCWRPAPRSETSAPGWSWCSRTISWTSRTTRTENKQTAMFLLLTTKFSLKLLVWPWTLGKPKRFREFAEFFKIQGAGCLDTLGIFQFEKFIVSANVPNDRALKVLRSSNSSETWKPEKTRRLRNLGPLGKLNVFLYSRVCRIFRNPGIRKFGNLNRNSSI